MEGAELSFGNILISCNESDYTAFFEPPVLNAQKTVLTLKPKPIELLNNIPGSGVSELLITLKDTLCVNKDGKLLPLKQDEHSSFYVCYKKEIEEDPPQEIDFFITRHTLSVR